MVVDPRHDHSLRAPRPDLTVALGRENAPNACNDCHRDRSAQWAAQAVRRWYPGGQQEKPHYALALHAGRTYQPGRGACPPGGDPQPEAAGDRAGDGGVAPARLTSGPSRSPRWRRRPADADPLVRLGAATALEALPPKERVRIGVHLLWDPVRAVRVEAVPAFADVPDAELATEQRAAFDRSLDDFLLAQRSNAERPESHVNLGIVHVKRGRLEEARRDYDAALRLAPWFLPAYVNLADLLRQQGKDDEGAKASCGAALQVDPTNASVHHALGLLLVRRKRPGEALAELGRAAELDPGTPDFAYAYAIGLHSAGRADEAIAVLRAAQKRSPGARGLLVALVTIHRERGSLREARAWARKLVEAAPGDPSARGPRRVARARGGARGAVDWAAEEAPWRIDPAECRAWAQQAKAAWEVTPLVEMERGRPGPGGLRAQPLRARPGRPPAGCRSPGRRRGDLGPDAGDRRVARAPRGDGRPPRGRSATRPPPACGRRRSSRPRSCSRRGFPRLRPPRAGRAGRARAPEAARGPAARARPEGAQLVAPASTIHEAALGLLHE